MPSNIVRFDPFEDLSRIQRELNRYVDDNGRSSTRNASEHANARTWAPVVDIAEDTNEIRIKAELPGIKQSDIDIELTGDTLTLRGERKFEDTEKRDNYVRIERSYGAFHRSFTIGVPVDQNNVNATFKDGILEVRIPKSEETKPKKVAVNIG